MARSWRLFPCPFSHCAPKILENPRYALDKSVRVAGAAEFLALGGAKKSTELLRSQDRVVSLLYHRTFPVDASGLALPNPLPRDVADAVEVTEADRSAALGQPLPEAGSLPSI